VPTPRRFSTVPVLFLALVMLCGACDHPSGTSNQTTLPSASGALPLRVLSLHGPYSPALGHDLFVDTSLTGLRSQVPPSQATTQTGCPVAICWPEVSDQSLNLYVASWLTDECNSFVSIMTALTRATTIEIRITQHYTCPPGGASAALPPLALMAIPMRSLPAGQLVTIRLLRGTYGPAALTASTRLP
jgi:hypothetical protein